MDVALLAVGRLRPACRELCDTYLKRMGRSARVSEREVRESRRPGAEGRREEGRRLLDQVPERATVVALDGGGRTWSSAELAREVDRWRLAARPVAFVIGGSTGLDDTVLERADRTWSLGPLTLPHELARVIVCEQLYRAFSILEGKPYHK
jgi:23S rRNA (pseudouridine1915-N3)-methyltransferase